MARRSPDGESRLDFYPDGTIVDLAAPSAATLNGAAAVPITPFALEYDFPESGQTIDTADLSSSFNKQDAGTYGGDSATLTAHRDSVSADDDAWTGLPRGTRGVFVERLFGGDEADYAAADEVSLYQGVVISRAMQSRQRNTTLRFAVNIAVTEEPKHNVAVVV